MVLLKILVIGFFIKVYLDDKDWKLSIKINIFENDVNNVLLFWIINFYFYFFF